MVHCCAPLRPDGREWRERRQGRCATIPTSLRVCARCAIGAIDRARPVGSRRTGHECVQTRAITGRLARRARPVRSHSATQPMPPIATLWFAPRQNQGRMYPTGRSPRSPGASRTSRLDWPGRPSRCVLRFCPPRPPLPLVCIVDFRPPPRPNRSTPRRRGLPRSLGSFSESHALRRRHAESSASRRLQAARVDAQSDGRFCLFVCRARWPTGAAGSSCTDGRPDESPNVRRTHRQAGADRCPLLRLQQDGG